MVFVMKGVNLRITNFHLTIDENGQPQIGPLTTQLLLDMWSPWLSIAIEQEKRAIAAHERLLAAADDEAKGQALWDEMTSGMQAIAGGVFALGAVYSSVKSRIPAPPKDRPDAPKAGAAHIVDVYVRGFRLKSHAVKHLRKVVTETMKFRGWAVHPPAKF